jgi:hypothetical protein
MSNDNTNGFKFSIDNERLVQDYDTAKAESRTLDLELAGVQKVFQQNDADVVIYSPAGSRQL